MDAIKLLCKLPPSFTLLAITAILLCLHHTKAQESNSKFVELEADGVIQEDSGGYYDAELATWMFSLNLLIHSLNSYSSTTKRIMFRIDLVTPTEAELKNNPSYSQCQNNFTFSGDCRERNSYSKYFLQRNDNYTGQILVAFDNVYTGCYKLKINCCTNRISCDDCYGKRNLVYLHDLGYVETNLVVVNVSAMNISIRLSPNDRGALVEFKVDYHINDNEHYIPFTDFDVEISNIVGDLDKANVSRIVRKMTTDQKLVTFDNCTDNNNVICKPDDVDSLPKNQTTSSKCVCLPVGDYKVTVNPRDSRCNHPQVCKSIRNPCARYSIVTNLFKKRSRPASIEVIISRSNYVISCILTSLLVLLSCAFLISLTYFKRDQLWSSRSKQFTHAEPEEMEVEALTAGNCRVLLVYDANDARITTRAAILREQLVSWGVTEVYDAGDPKQEEDVNIRGEINWFSGYINDPDVCIVVIQSQGMARCQRELMRDRISAGNGSVVEEQQQMLLSIVDQLVVIASANGSNNLYDRIFVTTYSDMKCPIHHSYLTPYRCYSLPEHSNLLLRQLFAAKSRTQPVVADA